MNIIIKPNDINIYCTFALLSQPNSVPKSLYTLMYFAK